MRLGLFSQTTGSFVKALLFVGSVFILSACNTTTDSQSLKSGLVAKNDNPEQNTDVVGAETDVALADPTLPDNVPLPALRGGGGSMLSYASANTEISPASVATTMAFETPDHAPDGLDDLISKYAVAYEVPESLVRRVVHRESRFNPEARNGAYWGLMQISHPTARGMGYAGTAKGLLDAETNLKYAVRYLSGAYKVADGDENQAVRFYARGYYYDAKRKGLLRETGLDGSFRAAASE